MNSIHAVELSNLEHRYAEALTAGKDVKTLSNIYEQIKAMRKRLNDEAAVQQEAPVQKGWSIEAA